MSDFIPWVPPGSSEPLYLEEGKEEEMTGLVDRYAARKQKRQENVERRSKATTDQADGSSRPITSGSSKVQAISIPSSPKTGSNNRLDIEDNALRESRDAAPTPPTLQIIPPPVQVGSRPSRSEFTRTELKRPPLPDQILTNSYLLARGPAPPKEEVSVPRLEEVKHIVHRWEPFNRGESLADRLNILYSMMLRMSVVARANGVGEDYSVTVPVGTNKEDLQQIIDDGIQICNHNYIQSSELVR